MHYCKYSKDYKIPFLLDESEQLGQVDLDKLVEHNIFSYRFNLLNFCISTATLLLWVYLNRLLISER